MLAGDEENAEGAITVLLAAASLSGGPTALLSESQYRDTVSGVRTFLERTYRSTPQATSEMLSISKLHAARHRALGVVGSKLAAILRGVMRRDEGVVADVCNVLSAFVSQCVCGGMWTRTVTILWLI